VSSGRLGAVVVAVLSATLVLALIGPAVTAAKPPAGLGRFMHAMGEVESGGNYAARNRRSGAYGKYQILPSNWPSWASTYLGNRRAKPTPANQDKVAAGKFTSLYRSLDSWRRVAYWWLTGSKRTSGWSSYAKRYVARVMRLYAKAGGKETAPAASTKARRFGETSASIDYGGTWKSAKHTGYAGDKVRYATKAGATATFAFTGRKVSWFGPLGPTRGKAKVYIDGEYVKTVDLRRSAFDARAAIFRKAWSTSGKHTLTIEVVGTRGRPMVAIDEFTVLP
jgi:Transglycosylase-like domain